MKSESKQRMPRWMRDTARRGRYLFLDALDLRDKLLHKGDPSRPPRRIVMEIGGLYEEIGQEFLQIFKSLVHLEPTEHILEIGCGAGRIANPLARYLREPGTYDGQDIVPAPVRWCQGHITAKYPNFRFIHADVHNTSYNRRGRILARNYVFPYPDRTFDFVFLTSVFTHMLPDDLQNYLSQCARVMKVGGRCLITFFLINDEVLGLLQAGRSALDFPNVYRNYRTAFRDNPEAGVAYDEPFIRECYARCGLEIVEPVRYGRWSGRVSDVSSQDVVLARRTMD